MGLAEASLNAGNYDYSSLICGSPDLQIVLNDGRTWVSSRIDQFQKRFTQDKFVTEVYLVDPKQEFAKVIAAKTGYDISAHDQKTPESIKRFTEEFRKNGSKGILRIYFLKFFPPHCVIIGTDSAVFSLYNISSGRGKVPTFLVTKTGSQSDIFATLKADIDGLKSKNEATLCFDSETEVARPVQAVA